MSELNAQKYAETVCNNTAGMLREMTAHPDGSARRMSDELACGVLNAQSNLAIAAALMLVAKQIQGQQP